MEASMMAKAPKYYIVEADALPEIYLKVAEAKRLLESGEVKTVNSAAQRAGVSRSAFYKYRDAIRPFQDMLRGRVVTVQMMLRDEPGVLSSVLNLLAEMDANILTINQAIPGGGSAAVTIGLEAPGLGASVEGMLEALGRAEGVLRCQILAG